MVSCTPFLAKKPGAKTIIEFSKIQDVEAQCEMMAKKATVMHVLGEYSLANDYAAKYLDLRKDSSQDLK
jgi:anaphase-promoting complex subunit 5